MNPVQVMALAEEKTRHQVGDDNMVTFVALEGMRAVGDDETSRSSGVITSTSDLRPDPV
jgi:hypothetical protein